MKGLSSDCLVLFSEYQNLEKIDRFGDMKVKVTDNVPRTAMSGHGCPGYESVSYNLQKH